MHDWVLVEIRVEWSRRIVVISLLDATSTIVVLRALEVRDLHVPVREEWGRSNCVNEVRGPQAADGGLKKLEIEMQSGDCVEILAAKFEMPPRDQLAAP